MNHNQNRGLVCQAMAGNSNCGMEGDAATMKYSLLPNGNVIVTCPTCDSLLAAGFKLAGKPYVSTTVITVRALAEFKIEFVGKLQIRKGCCSFRDCGAKLDGDKVLRNGKDFRRICESCAAAFTIIATKDKDAPKPESFADAQKAIAELEREEQARAQAAMNFALAQIAKPETAPAPKSEAETSEPEKMGEPAVPRNYGSRFKILTSKERGLGSVAFQKARRRAYEGKTVLAEEVAKTTRGRKALSKSVNGLAVLRKLGLWFVPEQTATDAPAPAPQVPVIMVPVTAEVPRAEAQAQ